MNKQTAQELLMETLYDEISEDDLRKLQTYLKTHPALQQELDEMKAVRSILQKASEVQPDKKLTMVELKEKRSFAEWQHQAGELLPRSIWGKTALAIAVCIILAFIGLSAANLNIHSTKNGFSVNLGYNHYSQQPAKQAELSNKQVQAVLKLIRRENGVLMAKVAAKTKPKVKISKNVLTADDVPKILTKMRKKDEAMIASFAKKMSEQNSKRLLNVVSYLQKQRLSDLKLVGVNLQKMQLVNAYHFAKTNRVLGDIVQAADLRNEK
jgi:hypothetical protein